MKLSICSSYFRKCRGTDEKRSDIEAARLCKQGGFDTIDCTTSFYAHADRSEALRKAHILARELADEGITVDQSHAPFNRYSRLDTEEHKRRVWGAFEVSAILGVKNMVIHADEYFAPKGKQYSAKDACDYAYDYFAPYVEFAKKHGMGVAIENVFGDMGIPRYGSEVEDIISIIDRFNDPCVGCCWDFGHAAVAFGEEKMLDKLKQVGSRLTCTHVHDNYVYSDMHLPPYMGKIDWESHMAYLKEVGYNGTFTYEFVYGCIPDELLPDYIKLSYKTAQFLTGEIH